VLAFFFDPRTKRYRITSFTDCSRCRTRQPGCMITQTGRREHITPVLYDNFTGCMLDAVLNSSWPFSCTRLHTVSHRRTSPMTVCWWRKSVDVCDQLMHGLLLYRGPGPSLVTEVLLWLVRGSGTVYRLH